MASFGTPSGFTTDTMNFDFVIPTKNEKETAARKGRRSCMLI
jgi:hypothetical protein